MPAWLTRVIPQKYREVLRRLVRLYSRRPEELRSLLRQVAFSSLRQTLLCYSDFNNRPLGFTEIQLRGYRQAIRLRNGTSDFAVFRDVIICQQYRIPELTDVQFIVDAGANIGLTSLYLLKRYPQATVIAIEPDPENFEIASHNLAPYRDRCHLIPGGLWSENTELGISRGTYRDGRHWATQTVPVETKTSASTAVYELQTLLEKFAFRRIDLLKVDIEGAELQVFRDGDTSFLKNTQCCAIELHDDDCVDAFRSAITPYEFETYESGELLIAIK